jgi:hypothetical protein
VTQKRRYIAIKLQGIALHQTVTVAFTGQTNINFVTYTNSNINLYIIRILVFNHKDSEDS